MMRERVQTLHDAQGTLVPAMLTQSFFSHPPDGGAGPAPLSVNIFSGDDDTLVVTPTGEADFYTVPGLWEVLIEATGAGRSHVIVDLDQLTFMDASALGVLVDARLRLAEAGGTLLIRCTSRLGQRLLTLAGLDDMLDQRAQPAGG